MFTCSMLYLSLLCKDLFVMQPALLANITECDGSQFRGGVTLGPGLLLSSQALQRLKHKVSILTLDIVGWRKMYKLEIENSYKYSQV